MHMAAGNKMSRIVALWAVATFALFPESGGADPRAAQVIANARVERLDVPRIELAARLMMADLAASPEFQAMRENAAREFAGRPDGVGNVSTAELAAADAAIARQIALLRGGPSPSFCALARLPGRPQIPGLHIVYLHPLGDPAAARRWQNIIAHQTEGPAGATRNLALAQ